MWKLYVNWVIVNYLKMWYYSQEYHKKVRNTCLENLDSKLLFETIFLNYFNILIQKYIKKIIL